MLELRQDGNGIVVRGDEYELSFPIDEPNQALFRVRNAFAASLFIPSTCDADGRQDAMDDLSPPEADRGDSAISVVLEGRSKLWGKVRYLFNCSADGVTLTALRHGIHSIDTLRYLEGRDVTGKVRPSTSHWSAIFNPEPNARRKHYFAPAECATIGVSSDPNYYRGNWLFTPGPLCYAADLAGQGWLAAGIAPQPGGHNFDQYEYRGSAIGFGLHLRYDGHCDSPDTWESPRLVLLPAADEYDAVASYCSWLRRQGLAPIGARSDYDWWHEPIFCGWGEQVALERRTSLSELPPVLAADHCTQANYERFFTRLQQHDITPGTVVIDDKWQQQYGLNTPDTTKWPDMAGFIGAQHDAGRRVLLWLRAWHPEGLPASACLVDEAGQLLAVDPSAPHYETHLRAQVRSMLLDLGADGFKIDFTHRLPVQHGVHTAGGIWGIELLKRMLGIIHDEAKHAKDDALIMTHTANPYFADVVDMLRLNDIANVVGQPSYLASMVQRARIARLASPHWIIDTDNWPSPNRAAWLEYSREQLALGVPSLYYVERIYHLAENGEVTDEPLQPQDYGELASLWSTYRSRRRGVVDH